MFQSSSSWLVVKAYPRKSPIQTGFECLGSYLKMNWTTNRHLGPHPILQRKAGAVRLMSGAFSCLGDLAALMSFTVSSWHADMPTSRLDIIWRHLVTLNYVQNSAFSSLFKIILTSRMGPKFVQAWKLHRDPIPKCMRWIRLHLKSIKSLRFLKNKSNHHPDMFMTHCRTWNLRPLNSKTKRCFVAVPNFWPMILSFFCLSVAFRGMGCKDAEALLKKPSRFP